LIEQPELQSKPPTFDPGLLKNPSKVKKDWHVMHLLIFEPNSTQGSLIASEPEWEA